MGAAGEPVQERGRLLRIARLPEDVAVERDVRVRAQHELAGRLHRAGVAPRVLQRVRALAAPAPLPGAWDPHLERDARLLEDRPPLGRAGGEDQRSGKNSFASRSADSAESDPWTMFWPTATAKSPRIEPVVASSGLVAPIT